MLFAKSPIGLCARAAERAYLQIGNYKKSLDNFVSETSSDWQFCLANLPIKKVLLPRKLLPPSAPSKTFSVRCSQIENPNLESFEIIFEIVLI